MKYTILFAMLVSLFSCSTKPHIKAKLKSEKIQGDCAKPDPAFSMNSNINGERYEFQDCLNSDFDGKNFTTDRKGDTVLILLPRNAASRSLYQLTLDLDVYPRYHFLTIGENTYIIASAKD